MNETSQLNLLEGLLRQFSPTLQEDPAVQYLADEMRALGFSVEIDEVGNVIGSLGDGPREIVLLGHIDTVPGEVPVRWEGDLLFGRGAVDAKGPLACFTAAAALAGAQAGWRLTVIGAVGEEGDSRGAKRIRERYLAASAPAFCIIGEPSKWDHITLGYKGSAWVEYTVRRSLAHTASQVESACEAAIGFWNLFQAEKSTYNAGRPRAFDQLTTSLRAMDSARDGFSETARLSMNLRLPPELTVDQAVALMTQAAVDGDLRVTDGIECYRADKNTPLVRAFLSAIRKAGGQPGFLVKTGTSDMNIVGPAWNCPILAYGPGDSSLDHTPDEHISKSEYLTGVQVLRHALVLLQEQRPL
jgi:[amino group carrier protein]-lysine/ornithine hydrolase